LEDRAAQDQRLVRAVLQGDGAAFGGLVARYQKLIAGVAWRYGVQRQEIEDVVSEVLLKAFRNLHLYRPDHRFSTWLYRLAVNHVVDHGRRARRERGRVEMPEQMADPAPGPLEGVAERERRELVRRALGEVPARYREALFLVYVEGLKVEETARALGLPVGTVKTRLLRGRRSLRAILVRRQPRLFAED
jgi:RNA polymerase sigma-70 factor (ECF subfamily)